MNDDEEEETKPEFESASLKHFGSVNRIRVSKSKVSRQIKKMNPIIVNGYS